MTSIYTLYTQQTPYRLPSPTLTNPDMILPVGHDAPESPETPRSGQRPPSLSAFQARAQSADRAGEGKKMASVTSSGPPIERIRTKGRRSFGESLGNEDGRAELRKGTKPGHMRLNGGSSSSSSSPVDSTSSTPIGDVRPPTSNYNGPSWNQVKYKEGANDDRMDRNEPHRGVSSDTEDHYESSHTRPKHADGVITSVERGDPYSHAQMSIRAEQILQNAKRRLTVSTWI